MGIVNPKAYQGNCRTQVQGNTPFEEMNSCVKHNTVFHDKMQIKKLYRFLHHLWFSLKPYRSPYPSTTTPYWRLSLFSHGNANLMLGRFILDAELAEMRKRVHDYDF